MPRHELRAFAKTSIWGRTRRRRIDFMGRFTRLEKLLFRLEAQRLCLEWAFKEIEHLPGIVFEMGLGHGRTYDHLRTFLPERDIYVLDREVDSFDDCVPPADRLLLGDIEETLVAAAERFGRTVILAHADLGSYTEAHNLAVAAKVSRSLAPVLAPSAIVISDLPLELADASQLALPDGAREGRYFLYRNGG